MTCHLVEWQRNRCEKHNDNFYFLYVTFVFLIDYSQLSQNSFSSPFTACQVYLCSIVIKTSFENCKAMLLEIWDPRYTLLQHPIMGLASVQIAGNQILNGKDLNGHATHTHTHNRSLCHHLFLSSIRVNIIEVKGSKSRRWFSQLQCLAVKVGP